MKISTFDGTLKSSFLWSPGISDFFRFFTIISSEVSFHRVHFFCRVLLISYYADLFSSFTKAICSVTFFIKKFSNTIQKSSIFIYLCFPFIISYPFPLFFIDEILKPFLCFPDPTSGSGNGVYSSFRNRNFWLEYSTPPTTKFPDYEDYYYAGGSSTAPTTPDPGPQFIDVSSNQTVVQTPVGATTFLHCKVEDLRDFQVWRWNMTLECIPPFFNRLFESRDFSRKLRFQIL